MHGGAASVQISWSLRYQRQEDGKRGAPTVQARLFWKHHKGKRHSNMEYFKLLDKKNTLVQCPNRKTELSKCVNIEKCMAFLKSLTHLGSAHCALSVLYDALISI